MITVDGKEIFTTLEELVNPAYTALLLVDIQNDFCSPGGYFEKSGVDVSMLRLVPSRVEPVLAAARNSGVMVVHIQNTLYPNRTAESGAFLRMGYIRMVSKYGIQEDGNKGKGAGKTEEPYVFPGGITVEGTYGWQIVDQVAPHPGEIIIQKHRSSTFVGTDLDMILRANGIKSVVVAGVVTEGCVFATATGAQYFDYYSILLRDCVATASREISEAALLLLSGRLDVVSSSEVIGIWAKNGATSSTRPNK